MIRTKDKIKIKRIIILDLSLMKSIKDKNKIMPNKAFREFDLSPVTTIENKK